MVDVNGAGTAERDGVEYMQVAIADHVVLVIMQLLKRARPWQKVHLEDMSDYEPRMSGVGRVSCFRSQLGFLKECET